MNFLFEDFLPGLLLPSGLIGTFSGPWSVAWAFWASTSAVALIGPFSFSCPQGSSLLLMLLFPVSFEDATVALFPGSKKAVHNMIFAFGVKTPAPSWDSGSCCFCVCLFVCFLLVEHPCTHTHYAHTNTHLQKKQVIFCTRALKIKVWQLWMACGLSQQVLSSLREDELCVHLWSRGAIVTHTDASGKKNRKKSSFF